MGKKVWTALSYDEAGTLKALLAHLNPDGQRHISQTDYLRSCVRRCLEIDCRENGIEPHWRADRHRGTSSA